MVLIHLGAIDLVVLTSASKDTGKNRGVWSTSSVTSRRSGGRVFSIIINKMHVTWRLGWLLVISESCVLLFFGKTLHSHSTSLQASTGVMFFRLVKSVEQRKNCESSWGIEPQTSESALRCSTTEPLRLYSDRGLLRTEVHMTRVLHTARISNVDSVMFLNNNTGIMSCRNGTFSF